MKVIIELFFSSLVLMLLLGAILGSFGLQTWGYWQTLGTLYALKTLTASLTTSAIAAKHAEDGYELSLKKRINKWK